MLTIQSTISRLISSKRSLNNFKLTHQSWEIHPNYLFLLRFSDEACVLHVQSISSSYVTQANRNVTQSNPNACFVCQKINRAEMRKQKQKIVTSNAGNVHRIQQCRRSLFSRCFMQPDEQFLYHRNVNQIFSGFVRHRKIGIRIYEHSYLWQRLPYPSTFLRQLTNWFGKVSTWRHLLVLLHGHSDILCLLIQSNCTEFQLFINILN